MNTFRELVYMCLDELKLLSDDAYYTEEHIIFLLNKYRAFLLKQRYSDIKKQIPQGNYSSINVGLAETDPYYGEPCETIKNVSYYISDRPIPFLLLQSTPRVYFDDNGYFRGELTYVSRDRMRYVGNSKYTKTITYCTIGPDGLLYIKRPVIQCVDPDLWEGACLDNQTGIVVTGLFEDVVNGKDSSELLDTEFPIENALVPPLIELVVRELSQSVYRPDDVDNNSSDDLSGLQVKQ